jgi:hypothetical protein
MDLRKKEIKTEGRKICSIHSGLLPSVDVIEFQTTEAYSSLDLTNIIYNMYIHSNDENVDVIQRTRHNNLMQ